MILLNPNALLFAPDGAAFDRDVAEVSLLLTTEQAEALQEAALRCGLTVGQVLRRLVRDFLAESAERTAR